MGGDEETRFFFKANGKEGIKEKMHKERKNPSEKGQNIEKEEKEEKENPPADPCTRFGAGKVCRGIFL